ncbi:SusC/RagA family TonB-linked outer membrane protein [Puia dinghuensis]|uniref:SusC/RagA family TonB-linked outer membrane protein n=1 Tax=Puia dinghuensis TaxID=1792502 RepID=A0A8J2XTF4_9BACT|nr:TonB-dependent receptor [Puia dinghuensis]GGB16891.1 SusC/RagA family TonB-linked outer membrane protein [Puia dinghuensis]
MIRKFQHGFMVCGFLLLFLGMGQRVIAQNIRLDLRQTDLAKVVAALQQQVPSMNFSYSQEMLEKVKLDRVQFKASRLEDALQVLQKKYGLHYLMDGNTVTLKYVPLAPPVEAPMTEARKIEGTVADENGQPVKGATVQVRGAGAATATNEEGHYMIMANPGAHLVVTSVGFARQDVPVRGNGPLDVRLHQGTDALNEVVFIGYQKMRKSDFTGAVASVKAAELNVSAPNVGQSLVGKVAGVVVSQTDGSPYASPKIRVRGVGSLNASTDPLYVIDGYPAGNDLYINPNDIESIDILKDAASAAIYGSRASGGVVMITTKRGRAGKSKLEYDYQYGIDQLAHKVKLLNGDQFAQLVIDGRNDSYKDLVQNQGLIWNDNMYLDNNATRVGRVGNGSSISIPTELYDFTTGKEIPQKYNTDWQNELYRNAAFLRHNLAFSGGNQSVRYMISGDYQSQDGIMLNTGQTRVNFRANVDGDVNDKVKVGASIAYTGITNHETQEGRWDHSPAFGALIYMPVFPAYNPNGTIAQFLADAESAQYGYQSIENPIATAEFTQIKRQGNRATYNAFASYELIPHLVFKANLGLQTYGETYDYYLPSSLSNGTNPPFSAQSIAAANATEQTTNFKDELGEFTLTYDKKFGEHSINILGGYTAQWTSNDIFAVNIKGFSNDLIPNITAGNPTLASFGGTSTATWTLNSYLGRAQYNYGGKYYLAGSLRTDGSSRFGEKNKWAVYPSVSGGWNISKESFYKGWLADNTSMRLRASWGLSGNNNIGNYNTVQTFNSPVLTTFGGGTTQAYQEGNVVDPNLEWESTSQYNVGVDVGFFHDRISLIANYYDSRTYNLLINNNISAVSGNPTILTNLRNSRIMNRGFDFQVDAKVVQRGGFNFNVSGNISINRNKVLNLGGASTIISNGAERQYITHITEAGQPIGMFYGYKVAGMVRAKDTANINIDNQYYNAATQSFPKGYVLKGPPRSTAQTNPLRPGDLYFQDVNGDGVVNSKDLSIIGTPYPKFTYGFNLSASYRAVDLSASFAGSYGNQVLDGQDYYLYNMEGSGNQYVQVANRYRSESQPGDGHVYRASRAGTQSNSTRLSSFYLQDGSFFRCTNIALGYNLPDITVLHKAGVSAIRVYWTVNNAFTITKYKGYNPEVDYNYSINNAAANLTPGVDYGIYPLVRSYNMGVHVTF